MASSPSQPTEKKHSWWLTNKKVVDKYVREARTLIETQEPSKISAAVGLLDAALALSPRLEAALELKARSLLFLGRFREVANMLQDYIPSYKMGGGGEGPAAAGDDSFTSLGSSGDNSSVTSSSLLSRDGTKLLSPGRERSVDGLLRSFRCFSVADLKRKVLAGITKNSGGEGQWRYIVLGTACSHLGMMEDAMVLLQTGRRLASAAFRRESVCWSDDSFTSSAIPTDSANPSGAAGSCAAPPPPSDSESAGHLLSHIKLLLRRRTAAAAALDAGLPAEAIRHFSKVLDGRRTIPSGFAAGCLIGRAAAYRIAGRLAEAIADCNRALALDTSSIPALRARADLLEAVGALPDCLRDLDHLKLLYDSILRDRKLPGPPWRPHNDVRYRDIPANLRALAARVQRLRCRVGAGEGCNVDYYMLIGVPQGCTRSELERAHLVLTLKHKPEKAAAFLDRLEFAGDYRDMEAIRDQAKVSASILYRMMQKGYASIMAAVMEEAAQKLRSREGATAAAAAASGKFKVDVNLSRADKCSSDIEKEKKTVAAAVAAAAVIQGVFFRDMAAVGGMMGHQAIPVKYGALSC